MIVINPTISLRGILNIITLHGLLYPSLVLYIYSSVFPHNIQKRKDIHISSIILTGSELKGRYVIREGI